MNSHHGCALQTAQMQNDFMFKITDYLGFSKFIPICSCDDYLFGQFSQIGLSLIMMKTATQIYLINLNTFSINKTNIPFIAGTNSNSVMVSDVKIEARQMIFDFAKFSVSLFLEQNNNKLSMIMNNCWSTERDCVPLLTNAPKDWIFYHNWGNNHRFFPVWYDNKTQKIKCNFVHQIALGDEYYLKYIAFYCETRNQLSIVEIINDRVWKIIKDVDCKA